MRRDGKAKVFLASRLQLTPSSDWEQHSLSNFGNSNLPHSLRLSFLPYLTKNESFLHLFAPEFLILSYSFFCTEKVFLIFLFSYLSSLSSLSLAFFSY